MNSTDLRYLTATASAGTSAGAARELGVASSTICRRVACLEERLRLPIFERGRAGVRLTAGGSAVMAHARRALAALDSMQLAAQQNGSAHLGQIKIGVRVAPVSDILIGLFAEWRSKSPDLTFNLSELNDGDLALALEERRIDVALVPSFTMSPRVESAPVYRERLVVALPQHHHPARAVDIGWSELRDEIILVQGWDESQAHREFLAPLLGSGARFQAHAASKRAIFVLVAAGYGVALAPGTEVAFPQAVFRLLNEPKASFRVDLAWMPEMEEPAVGRFVAFMRDEARSRRLF